MAVFLNWLWPLLLAGLVGCLLGFGLGRRSRSASAAARDEETARLQGEQPSPRRPLALPPSEGAPGIAADPRDLVAVVGAIEGEAATVAELRRQIQILQEAAPKVIEKIIEKPVDNPEHVARIHALENEVAIIPELRAQLISLQAAQPKTTEPLAAGSKQRQNEDQELAELRARCAELEQQLHDQARSLAARDQEIRMLRQDPAIDTQAAKLAGFNSVNGANDLEIIKGIEPALAELLRSHGIYSFAELARTSPAQLQAILDRALPNSRKPYIETWPEQAELASRNLWRPLKLLQDTLLDQHPAAAATV